MRLAIFDVDGTVLRGNSWQEFFWWAAREWPVAAPVLLGGLALRKLRRLEPRTLREIALGRLRGLRRDEVEDVGRRVFGQRLQGQIRRAARVEVARRRAEGFVPVLATGAFDFLVAPIAEEIEVQEIVCTRLAYDGARCTGRIHEAETRGEAKAAAVRERFEGRPVDWEKSRAYSDDGEDAALWGLVGVPIMVCRPERREAPPKGVEAIVWPDV